MNQVRLGCVKKASERRQSAHRFMKLASLIAALLLFVASFANAAAVGGGPSAQLELSRIGDATHLEFSGRTEWKYDLKRNGNDVTLRLPGLSAEGRSKLAKQIDPLIKSVSINEHGLDDATEITFHVGESADYFDYLADQPSRLVLDFFPKDAPQAPATKPALGAQLKATGVVEHKVAAKNPAPADEEDDDEEEDAPPSKLPAKKAAAKPSGKAAKEEADDEDRKPAGTDFVLQAKGELPAAPSLAEQISAQKDFNHGIFDGGDPEFRRFSMRDYEIKPDAEIASRRNFYLPFPMLEVGLPQLKSLLAHPPTYEIVENDSRENKEARIILTLFSKHQRALFLKLAEEFLLNHPDSAYDEIVRYMIADAHYDIWRASNSSPDFEAAINSYLALVEKYPSSPMTPRTLLLMGYSYLDRGDSFGALKSFNRFARQYPNSKHIDRVNISIAQAYLKLNRFDDAYALLDQVEKQGRTPKGREEAAYRKGDIFFRKKDYAEAVNQYRGALKRFPNGATLYPNAWYNVAEAQFVQAQAARDWRKYREALDSYRAFLQKFPESADGFDHGGYAMTRMGELLGILGADPKRAEGAFLESGFRYRATPGAGVARIRYLTARMPTMKDKELASAMAEIQAITLKYAGRPKTKKEIAIEEARAKILADAEAEMSAAPAKGGEGGESGEGKGEKKEVASAQVPEADALKLEPKEGDDPTARAPELPGIEEFSSLLIADGWASRKEYDKAADDLISYYQKNPQSPNKDKFFQRIVNNLSDGLHAAVDHGNFIEALRRYSKNADGWFKNVDRVDIGYDVARAYEQAGVFKEATNGYRESLKKLATLQAAQKEHEHEIYEHLPKADEINLRLAAVADKEKDFAAAESALKKIPAAGALTDQEKIERAEVSADVAEARGQGDAARKYLNELTKAWAGQPSLTSPLHLRLAKLESTAKNFKAADQHLATILNWKKEDAESVNADTHAAALEARADLFVTRGLRDEAAKTYRELLSTYESSRPLASVRYRLGQLLFQDGDLKGAQTVWNDLKPGKDGMWQRLANEQMAGAKWQREYKKYLDRIPAAADLRDEAASTKSSAKGSK